MQSLYDEEIRVYDLMNYKTGSNLASKFINFVEEVFSKHSSGVKTVLDIGCGSGEPTIELAKRGYRVTGIDINDRAITYALNKVRNTNLPIKFHHKNLQSFDDREKYNACKRQMKIVQNRQMKSVHSYLCFPFFFHFSLKGGGFPFRLSFNL